MTVQLPAVQQIGTIPTWSTACPDWWERLQSGRSLVPELPLFEAEAAKALRIFKRLRIPDVIGQPTMEEACGPWFFPIVEALFGSYDPERNIRMLQEVFLLIPKKNSKSSGAGAIMLVALIVNRRPNGEFLLIAPTKEIANIAFKQAKETILLDSELTKLFYIQDHIRKITHRVSKATLQIKAADTDVITGGKQVGTLIDETHVFAEKSKAAEIFLEVRGALTARPDGFLIQITTQSKEAPKGVYASELTKARDVRDGKLKLPLLPILYELPEEISKDDGWKNPKYWPLINPNLGRSVNQAYLENQLAAAEVDANRGQALALLASQHFNVQVGTALRIDGWAGAAVWDAGAEKGLTLKELLIRCEVATVGIDGGGLDDLFGVAVIGREKVTKRWLLWTHAFISPIGIERRKANETAYRGFEAEGSLTIVEKLPDDVAGVADVVREVRDAGILDKVGVDAAGIGTTVDILADLDITQENDMLGGIRQGIALMGAIKTVERKLADKSFVHGGTKLMAWCVGNAKIVQTRTAIMISRDEAGFGKIDPLMAVFNAAELMALNPQPKSTYLDTESLILL